MYRVYPVEEYKHHHTQQIHFSDPAISFGCNGGSYPIYQLPPPLSSVRVYIEYLAFFMPEDKFTPVVITRGEDKRGTVTIGVCVFVVRSAIHRPPDRSARGFEEKELLSVLILFSVVVFH
jgi:hypothetical protein